MRRSHDSVRQASKTQARIASNQHRNQRLRDRVAQSYRRVMAIHQERVDRYRQTFRSRWMAWAFPFARFASLTMAFIALLGWEQSLYSSRVEVG